MKPGIKRFLLSSLPLLLSITYLALGFLLLPRFRYVVNADGLSYISIAKKYLAGKFLEAVNGYWSPLFSWLLIPFVRFFEDPFQGARILNLLLSFLLLLGFYRLTSLFSLSFTCRLLLFIAIFPLSYYFAFAPPTPDLLVLVLLVFYFYFLFHPSYVSSSKNSLICGFLGGLAYLAKAYHFPFFLIHFSLINWLYYRKEKNSVHRQNLPKFFLGGLAIFLILCSTWISLISSKYERLTFSTATQRAWSFIFPGNKTQILRLIGLFPPPDATAISAWEDPSFLPVNRWNPLTSFENLSYFLLNIFKNLFDGLIMFYRHSIFYLPVIFFLLVIVIRWLMRKFSPPSSIMAFSLLSFYLYPLGYFLVFLQERFIWIEFIWLILFTAIILSSFGQHFSWAKKWSSIILIIWLLSYTYLPFKYLFRDYDRISEFGTSGREIYSLSQILEKNYQIRGRAASNDRWNESLFIAYYTRCQYFGQTKENLTQEELINELKKYRIKYFFLWGSGPDEKKLESISYEMARFDRIRLKILLIH